MIKPISFPKEMKIEDVIKLLEEFKNEQGGIIELLYSEFLCFKCQR